jgi:hypothetical protein
LAGSRGSPRSARQPQGRRCPDPEGGGRPSLEDAAGAIRGRKPMSALQLETAAALLGPLLDEVVFIGGATGSPLDHRARRSSDAGDGRCRCGLRGGEPCEVPPARRSTAGAGTSGGDGRSRHLSVEKRRSATRSGCHADRPRHPRLLQSLVRRGDLQRRDGHSRIWCRDMCRNADGARCDEALCLEGSGSGRPAT